MEPFRSFCYDISTYGDDFISYQQPLSFETWIPRSERALHQIDAKSL